MKRQVNPRGVITLRSRTTNLEDTLLRVGIENHVITRSVVPRVRYNLSRPYVSYLNYRYNLLNLLCLIFLS